MKCSEKKKKFHSIPSPSHKTFSEKNVSFIYSIIKLFSKIAYY